MFRNQGQASLPPGRDPSYATTTTKITTTSTTTTTTEPPITTTVPRIGKKQKNTFLDLFLREREGNIKNILIGMRLSVY